MKRKTVNLRPSSVETEQKSSRSRLILGVTKSATVLNEKVSRNFVLPVRGSEWPPTVATGVAAGSADG
jgi:hypothetical protein